MLGFCWKLVVGIWDFPAIASCLPPGPLLASRPMSLPLLAALTLAFLTAGYFLYGRYVAGVFRLDDATKTPAVVMEDGVDYVPTKPFYLLGQHFSAIAAAGPIVGPIAACLTFGWLPCLLWIGFGVVFIGAVHDFSALVASLRHRGGSIAEIVRENMGRRAWIAMLAFIWLALVYVIVAFTDVTVTTFTEGAEELQDVSVNFVKGGAVAAASVMYLLLAVGMGVLQKVKPLLPLWLVTLVFVPATLGVVWLGTTVSTWLVFPPRTWAVLILAYCFVASILPVWLLLQPRGYLGGFVLYMALAVGVIGIFFGGFEILQPAWKVPERVRMEDSLFPFLFVTIACGACSGFHGLVCSGTTSKQIARESDCRPVGYGAMLLEAFVALIALSTVIIAAKPAGGPGTIYGDGIGRYLTLLLGGGQATFAKVFGAMVFSTFVFDTLDVATRLCRYILQEIFGARGRVAALGATAVSVGIPLGLVLQSEPGSWRTYWTLFGTSNQLLAGLTLLLVSVWLYRSGRPVWVAFLPMLFVLAVTGWALVAQVAWVWGDWRAGKAGGPALVNGAVAALLLGLTVFLIGEGVRAVKRP